VKVRWLRGGTRSLRALHAHIALDNPAAARRVVQRIKSSVARLRTFPLSGRTGRVPGSLELVITHLQFIVVYRVSDQTVEILRVFHTSQDWPEHIQ
jgi:toxin ParE1/3/4